MSDLNDDAIVAFCETHSQGTGSDAVFDVLVDLAVAYVRLCQTEDRPDPERPETFEPQTLGGIDYKQACVQGLRENLDLRVDL